MKEFMAEETAYFKEKHKGSEDRISSKISKGDASEIIIETARKNKFDLISIGAHGRVGIMHSKLGGVAQDILANPPCDVLVARI